MPSDNEIRDLLREHKLRATRARVVVLRTLYGQEAPASHPELTELLSSDGWDRSTLYRNLVDLAEVGILRRVDLGDHVWRYELATHDGAHDSDDHPHFLCTQCGDVSCLPEVNLSVTGTVPGSVSRGQVAVQLRGVCDDCA